MGVGICPSLRDLETWGYKMMNYAHVPELAAYKAMKDALVQLKTTGTVKLDRAVYEPLVAEFEELEGLPTYIRIETETVEKGK
jgi:2-methylisocitrate lyase-like PEP mutase family enzyme